MTDAHTGTPPYSADEPVPSRPRLGLIDMGVLLWRAKWLMLAVFIPIMGLGLLLALQMPKTYTASSRLLATLDDFYVYRPLAGGEAAGVTLAQEQIIQAELEILRSPVVAERVLDRFPLERLYPDLIEARERALARGEKSEQEIEAEIAASAVRAVRKGFGADAAPATPVISTWFEHEDAETSAEVLNALIGAYLRYRAELLADTAPESFRSQRETFQERLAAIEAQIRSFLNTHDITDFDSEREANRALLQAVRSDLLTARSAQRAVDGRLAALRSQLSNTSENVDLFVEDTSEQRLMELRLEREDLLSRYTPQSQPVRAINERIAQVEAFLASQERPAGTVRRGPNPIHQSLAQEVATLEGEARSLREQIAELESQQDTLQARQRLFTSIAPQWQALQRQRELAEQGVIDYATRESEARTRSELAAKDADNIRVLEPARPPMDGESLRLPVAVASALFAGLTALIAGLLYVFTRRGFATPDALARTSGLPVLCTVRRR